MEEQERKILERVVLDIKNRRLIFDNLHRLAVNVGWFKEAADSIILAKAWAGKMLGEFGTDTPYPKDGTRKTLADIEPTADSLNDEEFEEYINGNKIIKGITNINWKDSNLVEKADWLRQELAYEAVIVEDWNSKGTRELAICRTQVWVYLTEARMQLGFALSLIKKHNVNG